MKLETPCCTLLVLLTFSASAQQTPNLPGDFAAPPAHASNSEPLGYKLIDTLVDAPQPALPPAAPFSSSAVPSPDFSLLHERPATYARTQPYPFPQRRSPGAHSNRSAILGAVVLAALVVFLVVELHYDR